MRNAKRIRLALVATLLAIALFVFLAVATPILSAGENDRHSIVHHIFQVQSNIVDFDLGDALANTLVVIFPVTFIFLMFDLYGLRKSPVQHLGFFSFCLIAVVLNAIVSIVFWFLFGGWGPPTVGPIIATILVGTLIPATISEWRILKSSTDFTQNAK